MRPVVGPDGAPHPGVRHLRLSPRRLYLWESTGSGDLVPSGAPPSCEHGQSHLGVQIRDLRAVLDTSGCDVWVLPLR